ncbi:unnamed protein product [Ceutorhynchus assimilis]|uniref:Uncharacterized protein n=1 Tax=Ceutorhynchus assimilis TaxID=467358 RepID=A0A9N9MIS5_9CUCU|nr:unnamed protein product [Ceutorhynchus assimilis]
MDRVSKIGNRLHQIKNYSKREKVFLCFIAILSVTTLVFLICLLKSQNDDNICTSPECITAAHHILTTVDETVDPCEDFYQFACGNFLKTAIKYDRMSPLKPLEDMKKNALRQLVTEDRKDEDQLVKSFRDQRKYFRACMNTSAIEEDEDKTFQEIIEFVVGGWPLALGHGMDLFWPDVMMRARQKGVLFNFFLGLDIRIDFNTSQVYLELKPPPMEYYDKMLWREVNIQKLIEMAEHWGNHSLSASWEARKTIEFAKNLNEIVERAHNSTKNQTLEAQKMKISELKNFNFLRLHWLHFLKNMTGLDSLQEEDEILFAFDGGKYFEDLYYLIKKTCKKIWQDYIVILLITNECRFLSKKIETPCIEIMDYSRKDKTRKDYCFDQAISDFDGVAEAQFIRQTVSNEKRKNIKEIIENVKQEMENNLRNIKWMDDETREASIKHLRKITSAIGWTDIVFNGTEYERLFGFNKCEFSSDNIIEINQEVNRHYLDYRFKKIKEPFSFQIEHALSVPVLEVNAFYVKYWDILILVAPILYQPVYDLNRPQYLNYGSLGSIIGHELTHAFSSHDEDERQMYAKNTSDLWSNATNRNYDLEKKCVDEEYENYSVSVGITLENSSAATDENLADFTGLNLAYLAYQKFSNSHGIEKRLPGIKFTPNQLFWIMSSTYMCEEPRLKDPETAHTHPDRRSAQIKHALASFRVIGPLRNSPYFADDFRCKTGTKMNPEKKCRLYA